MGRSYIKRSMLTKFEQKGLALQELAYLRLVLQMLVIWLWKYVITSYSKWLSWANLDNRWPLRSDHISNLLKGIDDVIIVSSHELVKTYFHVQNIKSYVQLFWVAAISLVAVTLETNLRGFHSQQTNKCSKLTLDTL